MSNYEIMAEQLEYFREQLMDQVKKNKQLEREADWLALHAPAEAYTCGAGYDMTCACGYLIDFKNKKRCPLWVDYYGEYKDACPNDTFEEWKDYVFDDYDSQVYCAFDKQKCWREAARKAVKDD